MINTTLDIGVEMKEVTIRGDVFRFVFDGGDVFMVNKKVLFKDGVLNPDLIVSDAELREINDFLQAKVTGVVGLDSRDMKVIAERGDK